MTLLQHLISNLTDIEVAIIAGLNDTRSVREWRKKRKPNRWALERFATHFGKSASELMSEYAVARDSDVK